MGIFFEPRRVDPEVEPAVESGLYDFLMQEPPTSDAEVSRLTDQKADAIVTRLPVPYQLHSRKLFYDAFADALRERSPGTPLLGWKQASQRTKRVMKQIGGTGDFQTQRFLFAVLIFAVVVGGAAAADAAGLPDSSKALYGFGASIFGVIVGILGGETSK